MVRIDGVALEIVGVAADVRPRVFQDAEAIVVPVASRRAGGADGGARRGGTAGDRARGAECGGGRWAEWWPRSGVSSSSSRTALGSRRRGGECDRAIRGGGAGAGSGGSVWIGRVLCRDGGAGISRFGWRWGRGERTL